MSDIWMHTQIQKKSTYLIVGPEASLTSERSSRSRSAGGSSHSCVRGSQTEGVAIGGETNQQLLSWGTIALPVVHSIVLCMREYRPSSVSVP